MAACIPVTYEKQKTTVINRFFYAHIFVGKGRRKQFWDCFSFAMLASLMKRKMRYDSKRSTVQVLLMKALLKVSRKKIVIKICHFLEKHAAARSPAEHT